MSRVSWCFLAIGTCAAFAGCEGDSVSFPSLSLTKYDGEVRTVAIDPTGTTLASAGNRNPNTGTPALLFWDLKSGQSKGGYKDGKEAQDVCYSKDGKRLLSYCWGDDALTIWNGDTGKPVFHLDAFVHEAALTPDGKTLATSGGNRKIRLWNVDSGKERCTLDSLVVSIDHHAACVNRLAFSPDGALLAAANEDQTVRVWDVAAQKLLATLPDHKKPVSGLAFSPDGALLASGGEDGNVILWDVLTLKQKSMIVANYENILQIAFRPDGKQLAVAGFHTEAVADKGEEGVVTLFDTATGKAIQALTRTQQTCFCCVSFSPDGKLLAAGSASTAQPIMVWEQDENGVWKRKW